MSRSYVAGDYAGLSGGNVSFYYGYEETENDEWCFVAKVDKMEVMRIPCSDLGSCGKWDTMGCLIVGISLFLDKYPVVITEPPDEQD